MEKHRYGELARILCKMIPFWVIIGILAQPAISQTITGEVTDATSGEILPGVNVVVKGTTIGTATDQNGEYELNVPSLQDTLMFTFIGYTAQEVPINGRNSIDIALELATIAGEDVIVTGYSQQREEDITAAISSVDMESAKREMSASVLERLDGKVAGVTVQSSGSPGARNTVRIRGISSFQNNDPLYIIDGTPVFLS